MILITLLLFLFISMSPFIIYFVMEFVYYSM